MSTNRAPAGAGSKPARTVTRRQAVRATAAGAATLLIACSRGKSGGQSRGAAGQSAQPKPGGQLNIPTSLDPFDFDPTSRPSENRNPIGMAYDSLLSVKFGPDVKYTDLVIAPNLAGSWETPDAQTFTFHLRPGIQFANLPPVNGRKVDSADAKWSIEYLSRTGSLKDSSIPPSLNAPMFTGLDRVETPDASTMVVRFGEPFIPFLSYVALEWNPLLAHEVFERDGNFSNTLAGTGPWQLDVAASQKGTRWVYKRNPAYFLPGRPYIDQVNYLVLREDATRFAAFQARQVDFAPGSDVGDLQDVQVGQQIRKDNPRAIVSEYLATGGGHLYENVRRPPLNDLRIRKAMALSINRDEFIKVFSGGSGDWAIAGAPEGLFTQEEIKGIVSFDPAQAKQLVSAAGYPSGLDIEFFLTQDRGQAFINTIQLLQSQLKQANINLVLKPTDRATIGKNRQTGNFQLDYDLKTQDTDLDSYLFQTFYSKSPGNYTGIDDPDLDKLLLAQRREVDSAKRKEIFRQAARRIADQAWSAALFHGTAYAFWQPEVRNFNMNFCHRCLPVLNTWLDR
ncbi:MAG TPA: ABC transporter substrate-binding protein [Dehalococcoidia bacterium]|nr:ABC transporter substrate-binding protein [Dehalococcoidia bacterium]